MREHHIKSDNIVCLVIGGEKVGMCRFELLLPELFDILTSDVSKNEQPVVQSAKHRPPSRLNLRDGVNHKYARPDQPSYRGSPQPYKSAKLENKMQ